MKLTVGTNWDPELIEGIASIPEVVELMAGLPREAVGTDRPPHMLPRPSREQVELYVRLTHEAGRTLNFLLNTPSLGGREHHPLKQRKIVEYVSWLRDIGVDAVSVCTPFLIELVKGRFPELHVHISHNAGVWRAEQLKCFEEMGAEAVCLTRVKNRNIPLLSSLARSVSIPLQLTCRSVCLVGCPMLVGQYHLSITSALCIDDSTMPGPHTRHGHFFNTAWCHLYRVERPRELVKGCFIRPDDLPLYEKAGIHHFKLDTRMLPTPQIIKIAKAYASSHYEGDLKEVVNVFHFATFKDPRARVHRGGIGELTEEENIEAIANAGNCFDFARMLRFDNRGLDGYMAKVSSRSCPPSCVNCSICERYATAAQTWDVAERERFVASVRRYRNWVLDR